MLTMATEEEEKKEVIRKRLGNNTSSRSQLTMPMAKPLMLVGGRSQARPQDLCFEVKKWPYVNFFSK